MSDVITVKYITNQLKNKTFTLKEIYHIYSFLKVFPNLIDETIIRLLIKILNEKYPNSKLNVKIQRLHFEQKGSGIFSILGNVASSISKTALGTAKFVGNTALNRVESVGQSVLDKGKFITNHINCNNTALLECLSVSVPESAPLIAACGASGVETLGAGCIPALTELGGAAVICMTRNCKPKLF